MTKLRLIKGKPKARSVLTAKQSKFLDCIVGLGVENPMTYTDAYREAYDCKNMSDHNIRKEAHLLHKKLSDPIYAPLYSSKKSIVEESRLMQSLNRREKIINALEREATDFENGTAPSRVRSLELLGKIREVNLFSNTHVIEDESKTSEDIKEELEKKIRLLLGE